jgi:hypothetical protein
MEVAHMIVAQVLDDTTVKRRMLLEPLGEVLLNPPALLRGKVLKMLSTWLNLPLSILTVP